LLLWERDIEKGLMVLVHYPLDELVIAAGSEKKINVQPVTLTLSKSKAIINLL
jgi:hypothetical protein